MELLFIALLAFALGMAVGLILRYPETERPAAEVWLKGENLRMASTKIAAVDRNGNGLLCDLSVEIRPGRGEIYVPINPLVEIDYQYAQWIAVKVAAEITEVAPDGDGVGLAGADVTFYVSLPSEMAGPIQIVGGPSAGAAMAVLTVAAIENVSVRADVVLTGEVQADGSIGVVGGIYPKAKAAEDGGMNIFLVPQGQYVEVSEARGPFVWTRYEPISVLVDHAEEQGWGLEIQEVPTVEAAANLMLEGLPPAFWR
jgi:predicted S18 family serine protease